jgi:glycosyltransferase involved in cell wall biosynthesis
MISVIIPAYNEEAWLGSALEALKLQTHRNFEIIVVDNASTDNTVERARQAGVKVVREERKGTMWACEAGRLLAQGDIIVRMDADCIPESTWLEQGLAHFENPQVVAVSGPYHYHDASTSTKAWTNFAQVFYAPINNLAQGLKLGALSIGGNTFARASALDKIGGFNTNIAFYGDDTDLAKRLAMVGKVIFDPRLKMKTSARRFEEEGALLTSWRYVLNFFQIIFAKINPTQ